MIKVYYDFRDELGFVHRGGHVDCATDDEAEKVYASLKDKRGYANVYIKHEVVEETYVEVAFRTYDYVVKGKVKKGNTVKVIVNGNPVYGKVVGITTKKDLAYKEAEVVKGRG